MNHSIVFPRFRSPTSWFLCTACLLLILQSGCGAREPGSHQQNARNSNPPKSSPGIAQAKEQKTPLESDSRRKIVYNSSVELTVESFDGAEAKVSSLVDAHDGFIASANLTRLQGENRVGIWGLRVPVDNYAQLMDAASDLGVLVSRVEKADDVTADFYDLEARVKNKKQLEERIISLLDKSTENLKQVIEVENELARVRQEIEKLQGQLRYLSDVSQLATITLTIREVNQPVVNQLSPFSERLNNAWSAAWGQLITTVSESTLFLVRNLFQILGLLITACFFLFVVRKQIGNRTAVSEPSQ